MSRLYHSRPSKILGIDDEYTAYCLDEACALIISKIDNDEDRYQAWNIMNFREDLHFIIFTFNKEYEKLLPDDWDNGYKNVEIKVLKSIEDIKICSQTEYLKIIIK